MQFVLDPIIATGPKVVRSAASNVFKRLSHPQSDWNHIPDRLGYKPIFMLEEFPSIAATRPSKSRNPPAWELAPLVYIGFVIRNV